MSGRESKGQKNPANSKAHWISWAFLDSRRYSGKQSEMIVSYKAFLLRWHPEKGMKMLKFLKGRNINRYTLKLSVY